MIVGIDLGTTNSLVGVYEAGLVSLLADSAGERLTPSVVHYPAEGETVVGRAAVRQRSVFPRETVYSAKRLIGKRGGEDVERLEYGLAGSAGEPLRIRVRDRALLPEEVSSEVLRKLKADAERALNVPVEKAVITVPAYFNDAQRSATKRAGELAGLEVVRILNEPTAAALAFGLDALSEHSKIAVFDLGGGTFDVSVLELQGGVFQVLSTNGDTALGGDDIDAVLVEHFARECGYEEQEQRERRWMDPALRARLKEAAVWAKHRLSEEESVHVDLPFVEGERSVRLEITRAFLEKLARPVLERVRARCASALADARVEKADLNEVVLVGGATRMPLVRRMAAEIFGREPNVSQNPDEAVAKGAALQAAVLAGTLQHVVLLDVTPLSLGIETFGGLMNVIVPRNTTIPCKAGEMFTNAVAGQQAMLIRVLQGEREMAADNWELGKFEIPFTPLAKGKARVGVQFEIDADGILHVLARDTLTGHEQVVKMQSAVDVSDEAVEKMLGDSLEHAFEDMNARVFTEARLKAEEMLPSVGLALEHVGGRLSAEEREQIDRARAGVEAALAGGGAQQLKQAVALLDDATQRLATLLVETALEARGAQ
jgi:molecular chaperone DnaK